MWFLAWCLAADDQCHCGSHYLVQPTISFSLYQRAEYAVDSSITRMTGKSPLAVANSPNS